MNKQPARPRGASTKQGWVRLISPTCEDSARLMSAALDRRLTWIERVGLRIHLVLCQWCRRYGRQLRALRDAVRAPVDGLDALPRHRLPAQDRERIKAVLRHRG